MRRPRGSDWGTRKKIGTGKTRALANKAEASQPSERKESGGCLCSIHYDLHCLSNIMSLLNYYGTVLYMQIWWLLGRFNDILVNKERRSPSFAVEYSALFCSVPPEKEQEDKKEVSECCVSE